MQIVESSSGNTAIAIAMACAVKGYEFQPVVDVLMPAAKLEILRVYGAKPIVVGSGEIDYGDDMAALKIERRRVVESFKADPSCFVPDQYNNPDNAMSHMLTTGPEFVAQCNGDLDLAVVVMSTGGQIGGFGRYIKENIPGCRLIAVEPAGSTIFAHERGSYLNTGAIQGAPLASSADAGVSASCADTASSVPYAGVASSSSAAGAGAGCSPVLLLFALLLSDFHEFRWRIRLQANISKAAPRGRIDRSSCRRARPGGARHVQNSRTA